MSGERPGDGHEDAVAFVERFVVALVWGEHLHLWAMLGADARTHALAAAERRGLDAVTAARLRLGTENEEQRERFLRALVLGLRADVSAGELGGLHPGPTRSRPDGRLAVPLLTPSSLPQAITGGEDWEVATVVLRRDDADGAWRISTIEPRRIRRA